MREGLVSFEKVRDWEALQCQRHIAEIQGLALPWSICAYQSGQPTLVFAQS
jgi:hypothetical protein